MTLQMKETFSIFDPTVFFQSIARKNDWQKSNHDFFQFGIKTPSWKNWFKKQKSPVDFDLTLLLSQAFAHGMSAKTIFFAWKNAFTLKLLSLTQKPPITFF